MMDERFDAEMQALLSGYAAGTLTKAEESRLFEMVLNNQALFDAMADEESMRAALASPLVKHALLKTLNQSNPAPTHDRAPNHWLWVGLAASLFFGAISIYYWPTAKPPEPIQQIAVATPPATPQEPATAEAPLPARDFRAAAPAQQPAKRIASPEQPAPIVQPLGKQEAAAEKVSKDAAPPPPTTELKETEVITGNIRRQESRPAPAPASPAASGLAAAREDRSRSTADFAKSFGPQRLQVEIFNDNLNLSANTTGFLYAFLIDGSSTKPIAFTNPLAAASPRAIPLPAHSPQAEVWLVLTATEDPVLARALTGVLPLPNRPWLKLKTN
jgi:hypothetical protein